MLVAAVTQTAQRPFCSAPAAAGRRRMHLMVPFQKITEACKNTGLSQYYLRQGCKNGTVPHIMSGGVYYVNVSALMEELDKKKSS